MGIGRAVDAEDGLVDEVRSIGFARDVGAKMEEAGTLTKVTSGASAREHRGLAMALLELRLFIARWVLWEAKNIPIG